MDESHRRKLWFAMIFVLPIGYFMTVDTWKRYNTMGMVLTHGQIVAELPRQGMRPIVEIRVDGQPITVKATLMMDTARSMPSVVSFYFDGNPEHEVHCREETNPLWFLLLCVAFPVGLLIWDVTARRREAAKR